MTLANLPAPALSNDSLPLESQPEPLTDLQRAFATRYLLDYNERSAATSVGLQPQQGMAVLRDPTVMQYIASLQATREKFCILGKDFAASQWLEILPKLKGEEEIPLVTKNGSEFSAKKFHASELVRALVEIGNISGLSKPADAGPKKAAVNISLNFAGMASQPTVVIEQKE